MNKNYKVNNKIILFKNSQPIILFIFLFLIFTILYILFQIFIVYNIKINPQIDHIAKEDIVLKKDLVVIDELKTEEEKKIFLQDIPAVYSLYDSIFYSQWNDFDRLFTFISKERPIPTEIERYIKNQTEIKITDNRVIPLLILISDNDTLIKSFRSFLYSIYSNGITRLKPEEILTNSQKIVLLDWYRQFDSIKKETNINNFIFEDRFDLKIKEIYNQIFKGTNFDQNILPEEKLIFFEFIKENLKENLFYDQLQTDELKNNMLQQFVPKTINLTSGNVIIKKGELITAEKKRLILLIQKSLKENQLKLILNYLILFIITGSVLLFYLFTFANSFILYKRYSVYFFIILILSFGFYIFYELRTIQFIPVYFVFPLLLFYLLIEFAYSNFDRIIVYLSLIFILFLITNFDYILFYYGLILFTSLNFFPFQFSSYKKTIFSRVILSYTVTIVFSLLVNIIFLKSYKISDLIISGTLNIFISMILFFGLAPILENIFNFPTISKLLEICDLNNQFFSDFILKAPGTYHHSIIVANLAEKAAASCGANPYIARAGGLYHDIGKIRYSKYFVENQHGENPTVDILNPNMAVAIIKNHVKQGMVEAKKLHLPREVTDIIEQHHGTSLISFFYLKALEKKIENVEKINFCYNFPKPKTKEAAIIMIVDSIEAASRVLKKTDRKNIEKMVNDVISNKSNEGQLQESPLTLQDIAKIKESIINSLYSMYHNRINYPTESELKRLEEENR